MSDIERLLDADPEAKHFSATWSAWRKEVDTTWLETDMVRLGFPKPTIYREHEVIHVLLNLIDNLRAARETPPRSEPGPSVGYGPEFDIDKRGRHG